MDCKECGLPYCVKPKEHIAYFRDRRSTDQTESLTFDRLREINVLRCEAVFHKLDAWSVNDWVVAEMGEIGEALEVLGRLLKLADAAKKLRRFDDDEARGLAVTDRETYRGMLAKEIADVVIYADLLSARLNIDLGRAVRDKFNEVSEKRGSDIRL